MSQDRGLILYQTEIVSVSSILNHYVINDFKKNYEKYYICWGFFPSSVLLSNFHPNFQWHFVITADKLHSRNNIRNTHCLLTQMLLYQIKHFL